MENEVKKEGPFARTESPIIILPQNFKKVKKNERGSRRGEED